MKLLLENWRRYLTEEPLGEATRASKEGVKLPSVVEQLKRYITDTDHPKYFMHFGQISAVGSVRGKPMDFKFGINPRADYNTPLGIYSYPITVPMIELFEIGKLPYMQGQQFIMVFKPRQGTNIIYSRGDKNEGGISDEEYNQYLKRIYSHDAYQWFPRGAVRARGEFEELKYGNPFQFGVGLGETEEDARFDIINDVMSKGFSKESRSGQMMGRLRKNKMWKVAYFALFDEYISYPFGKVEGYSSLRKFIKQIGVIQQAKKLDQTFETWFPKEDYNIILDALNKHFNNGKILKQRANIALKSSTEELKYNPKDDIEVIKLTDTYREAVNDSHVQNKMGYIWNLTRLFAGQSSRKWRTLLQKVLGIDGVADTAGTGMIHESEPTQAVFFSKSAVELVEVFKNTETPQKIRRREEANLKKNIDKFVEDIYSNGFERGPSDREKNKIQSYLTDSFLRIRSYYDTTPANIVSGDALKAVPVYARSASEFFVWLMSDDAYAGGNSPGRDAEKNKLDAAVLAIWNYEEVINLRKELREKGFGRPRGTRTFGVPETIANQDIRKVNAKSEEYKDEIGMGMTTLKDAVQALIKLRSEIIPTWLKLNDKVRKDQENWEK